MITRNLLLLCAPALLALVAVAGEPTIEELIQRLGADDYATREAATKTLIERGETAVPALTKATEADDVEVRMRAGRALRSIQSQQAPTAPHQADGDEESDGKKTTPIPPPSRGKVRSQSTSLRFVNGEWEVTITSGEGAKKTTKKFKGKSLDELKKKHPEVRDALGTTRLQFGTKRGAVDPFKDFDKWFEENGFGNRRGRDPFGGAEDLQAEIERLRQWARWMAAQRAQQRRIDPRQRAQRDAEARLLGIQVRKPESVLDSQLQLRGRGLVVERIEQGSIAARLGLQRFDILIELNEQSVRSAADIRPALLSREPKQLVVAKVMRRAKIVSLTEKAVPVGPAERGK